MAAVESIPCPRCSAEPGTRCSSEDGAELPTGHAARWFALFTPQPLDTEHNLG